MCDFDCGLHVAVEVQFDRSGPRRAVGDDADAARAELEEPGQLLENNAGSVLQQSWEEASSKTFAHV